MEEFRLPKISMDLKQTAKGFWYLNSLKINSEDLNDFNNLLNKASFRAKEKINELNNVPKLKISVNPIKKQDNEVLLSPEEEQLYSHLKGVRLDIAKKENFPPYVIFHDSILRKMAKQKPVSLESMRELVGEKKFEKYGTIFIREIFQFS